MISTQNPTPSQHPTPLPGDTPKKKIRGRTDHLTPPATFLQGSIEIDCNTPILTTALSNSSATPLLQPTTLPPAITQGVSPFTGFRCLND
ncbi:MAG UNVERIFIED_CONTAM: hypothetical protein LVR18_16565 [Planctomycetaceae bacterium]